MTLERTIDPDHVGLDPKRLARIETHFARYVDDGRLPGWHIAVTPVAPPSTVAVIMGWTVREPSWEPYLGLEAAG